MTFWGPSLYAELIFDWPCPGMLTHMSRGKETTNVLWWSGSTRTTIIVSERCPPLDWSVPKDFCSLGLLVVKARESEPTSRKLRGPPEATAVWSPTRDTELSLTSIT